MSPIWGHVVGVVTVILMVTFIGIWIWAWRKQHVVTFSRMASLPMEDDDPMMDGSHVDDPKQELSESKVG